jgi:hypothetical protein
MLDDLRQHSDAGAEKSVGLAPDVPGQIAQAFLLELPEARNARALCKPDAAPSAALSFAEAGLVAEQERSGLQIASQPDSKSASAVGLRWWPEVRYSADSQHAAALPREEELPQSSGVEPAALAP